MKKAATSYASNVTKKATIPTLGAAVRMAFVSCYGDPVTSEAWAKDISDKSRNDKNLTFVSREPASHKLNTFAVLNPFTFPLACFRSLRFMVNSIIDRNPYSPNTPLKQFAKATLQFIPFACEMLIMPLSDVLNRSAKVGEVRREYIDLMAQKNAISVNDNDTEDAKAEKSKEIHAINNRLSQCLKFDDTLAEWYREQVQKNKSSVDASSSRRVSLQEDDPKLSSYARMSKAGIDITSGAKDDSLSDEEKATPSKPHQSKPVQQVSQEVRATSDKGKEEDIESPRPGF